MASNHTEGEVVPGDRVRSNLLFATSMDGSMRTHCGLTAVRVVCANTVQAALTQDGKGMVKISHRSTFDAEAVRRALGLARSSFEVFMSQARKLADAKVSQDTAVDVCRALFGQPRIVKPVVSGGAMPRDASFGKFMGKVAPLATIEHRTTQKVLALFNGAGRGADHPGVAGTAWGLLNAITEQIDHHAGRTADTRLDSAWFGQGNDTKQQALEALLTL
jgi:phage/plasmid-like protein (TIGR03299 family)